MKAHGISTNTPPSRSTPAPSASRRENSTTSKKRKLSHFAGETEGNAVDDDEGVGGVKEEFGSDGMDGIRVKGENDADINLNDNGVSAFTDTDAFGGGGISVEESEVAGNEDEIQELHGGSLHPAFRRSQLGEEGVGGRQNSEGTGVGMSESIVISD